MLLSNKNIDFLNNYKSNNINKLEINFGNNIYNNKDYCYFNKNIEQNLFFQTQTNFIKYKKNIEKIVLYNYHNYYLNISENTHIHKQNISKLDNDKINNLLFITSKECNLDYSNFSCKKNYNILEFTNTKYIINDEININFMNNKNNFYIKINIILNHNIDNSIKILNTIKIN